jgi:tetratricopeptide (TPR) repeat protein
MNLSSKNMVNPVSAACLAGLMLSLSVGCNVAANRRNMIGAAAYERGQIAQAINEFQAALIVDPNNSNAYYNLGSSYYTLAKQSGNRQWFDQAEQLYRHAIALNDQHVEAHRGLAALLIETNREQFAFDLLNTWQKRYPISADPLIEIARLYQEYGDHRRATDYLADALRIDSRNARALKAMGHVREVQGQYDLALDNYQRALQIDNQQFDVAERVAMLQTRLGRPSSGGTPAVPQTRYGDANPYVPR